MRLLQQFWNKCRITQRRADNLKRRRSGNPARRSGDGRRWARRYPTTAGGLSRPKIMRYRRLETLRKQSSTRFASTILDNKPVSKCTIDGYTIFKDFKSKWESPDKFFTLEGFHTTRGDDDLGRLGEDITQDEIDRALEQLKLDSAPGQDGVKPRILLAAENRYKSLKRLFNSWVDDGVIPPQIKECRSILIPKTADPDQLMSLTNWRPLTISSTIARTFSRILTNRLSVAIPTCPRQRGFIKAPGCSENVATLANTMREAKRNKKTQAVVTIDFAKAFDSVSHHHICAALRA